MSNSYQGANKRKKKKKSGVVVVEVVGWGDYLISRISTV